MTEDEVCAAAERLVQFHERFAPLFGKEQAQDHAYTYITSANKILTDQWAAAYAAQGWRK